MNPVNNIQVSVFARTDIGMHRQGNEDAFMIADLTTGAMGLGPDISNHRVGERGSLMVVSDGMGGAAAGEVASEMAVTSIREALLDLPIDLNTEQRLVRAAEIANERIWNHARENRHMAGMGATLTAVLVQTTSAYIAQVGDSRAYLIRGNQIKQLTKDQSLVQLLVDSGAIRPEQASSVPQNVIMQALGTSPNVQVAMTWVELYRGDRLLICSDGLSNKITDPELRQVVQETGDAIGACRRLVEMANARGGEDNITVIVASFDGESLHSAGDTNSITGSFRIIHEGSFDEHLAGVSSHFNLPPPPEEKEEPREQLRTLVLSSLPSEDEIPALVPSAGQGVAPVPVSTIPPTERVRTPVTVPGPQVHQTTKSSSKGPIVLVMVIVLIVLLLLLGGAAYFYFGHQLHLR